MHDIVVALAVLNIHVWCVVFNNLFVASWVTWFRRFVQVRGSLRLKLFLRSLVPFDVDFLVWDLQWLASIRPHLVLHPKFTCQQGRGRNMLTLYYDLILAVLWSQWFWIMDMDLQRVPIFLWWMSCLMTKLFFGDGIFDYVLCGCFLC